MEGTKLSPNGCSRIQAFKPFWLLPDVFHREFSPLDGGKVTWFPFWELAGFYRLYDQHSGEVIGETVIHDLAISGGDLSWDRSGGVYVGMVYVGPTLHGCIGDKSANEKDK